MVLPVQPTLITSLVSSNLLFIFRALVSITHVIMHYSYYTHDFFFSKNAFGRQPCNSDSSLMGRVVPGGGRTAGAKETFRLSQQWIPHTWKLSRKEPALAIYTISTGKLLTFIEIKSKHNI